MQNIFSVGWGCFARTRVDMTMLGHFKSHSSGRIRIITTTVFDPRKVQREAAVRRPHPAAYLRHAKYGLMKLVFSQFAVSRASFTYQETDSKCLALSWSGPLCSHMTNACLRHEVTQFLGSFFWQVATFRVSPILQKICRQNRDDTILLTILICG